MVPGEHQYLVLRSYKGYPTNSLVISFTGKGAILDYLEKRLGIRGIVEVVAPGDWDYDPETDVPRKIV